MRKVYVLPNLFTTASLFCGLMAILNVFNVAEAPYLETHQYVWSCWLILLAAVLDLLDGLVARLTRSESLFGAQYDSLADVVAFGVAPTILIYTRMISMENRHVAELIATTFPICGALRLARFNVQKTKVEKKSFTGLPIPAAAGAAVSGFLFFQWLDPDWNQPYVVEFFGTLMLILAILMVSEINYPSFKQIRLERRQQFELLPAIVFCIALVLFLKNFLEALVFAGFMGYILFGIVNALIGRALRRRKAVGHIHHGPSGPGPGSSEARSSTD